MLYLSYGIAAAVLVLVELIRVVRVPPFGHAIHNFMVVYIGTCWVCYQRLQLYGAT